MSQWVVFEESRKHMRVFKMQHYCEIPTPKGTLRGFFHKPNQDKHPVCLIFHGFTGQKTGTKFSYVQLSRMLEAKGIASFRFDFLGSGESDGNFVDMTFQDELSCARVILEECLKMENCTEIYVLGHSMGGAIASELAKLYPDVIKKMVLWAPAFNLPDALHYLTGQVERAKTYDHGGYEISDDFVEDILKRDFYQELDTYQNDLLVIHGTKDTTVPYEISNKYMKLFHKGTRFISIEDGNHNFDKLSDIKQVLKLTLEFEKDSVRYKRYVHLFDALNDIQDQLECYMALEGITMTRLAKQIGFPKYAYNNIFSRIIKFNDFKQLTDMVGAKIKITFTPQIIKTYSSCKLMFEKMLSNIDDMVFKNDQCKESIKYQLFCSIIREAPELAIVESLIELEQLRRSSNLALFNQKDVDIFEESKKKEADSK